MFSLFFELRWSAIHGYQILRFFFSDNQYFRMFLVSMADIIGIYERLPNDAVRAVAVAKRREYVFQELQKRWISARMVKEKEWVSRTFCLTNGPKIVYPSDTQIIGLRHVDS